MDLETGCPDDYDELFREYFPMMRQMVYRAGITSDDVQDVAMDILARFLEKDGISYYDPHRLHDVGENPDLPGARYRKAKFKGMLRGFTSTYVMQYRDKQMVRQRREPWRLEAQRSAEVEFGQSGMTWAESEDYAVDSLADTEVSVVIVSALQRSREILITRSTKTRDYGRLVDLAIEYGLLDGNLNRQAMRAELGVTASTLNKMIYELRNIMVGSPGTELEFAL